MSHKTCCCSLDDPRFERLDEIIKEYRHMKGALIPVLHEAQILFGYLPLEVQTRISEGLDIPLAEIYGVVTFYTQFTLNRKGTYKIQVCMGTACYVKGASQVLDELKSELGIAVGQSTPDGLFSLEACRCIGACGLAPVIMINSDVYGRLVADDIPGILKRYRTSAGIEKAG
ncbi:MAG TPA: NAD(P)H-dependent oxidoreductase subunit E [Clostridiales bacterium]|nr:NAD(P)H-dependent oxidoreductase subunit E [Clostridiales bacterium]